MHFQAQLFTITLHDMVGLLFCRTYILPEDLEHFLEPEKAQQAFDILDVDGDGQVTLHNIRDAVVTIYQVRKARLFLASLTTHTSMCAMFLLPCVPDTTSLHASCEAFHVLNTPFATLRKFDLCRLLWDGIQSRPLQLCTSVVVSAMMGWHSEQAAAVLYKCDCVTYFGRATPELGLQERKHLAFTLKDTKTIVGKLERIAAFVIHVLMAFFYLVIFNVSRTSHHCEPSRLVAASAESPLLFRHLACSLCCTWHAMCSDFVSHLAYLLCSTWHAVCTGLVTGLRSQCCHARLCCLSVPSAVTTCLCQGGVQC